MRPSSALYAPSGGKVAPRLSELLAGARARNWDISHLHKARARGALARAHGPIQGLGPKRTEPVFEIDGVSAFSNEDFREAIGAAPEARDFYVAGFGLADLIAATMIVGADLGLRLILIEDAVAASPLRAESAETVERVAKAMLREIAPQISTRNVFAPPRGAHLKLVKDDGT